MKEEIESRTTEYKYYICEGCGARFGMEGACESHEEYECAKSEKAKAYCESQVGKCEFYIRGRFVSTAGECVGHELGLCKVITYKAKDANGMLDGDPVKFYFVLGTTRFEIHEPGTYDEGYPSVSYSHRTECCERPCPTWGDFNTYGLFCYVISPEDYDYATKEIRNIIAAPPEKQCDMYKALLDMLQARGRREEE